MNKRILFGVLMICAVAALVAIGTWAYFSDVETSTGNIFTAGTLDLKINGLDDPYVLQLVDIEAKPSQRVVADKITVTNAGENEGIFDLHFKNVVNYGGLNPEPEQVYEYWNGERHDISNALFVDIEVDYNQDGVIDDVLIPDYWVTLGRLESIGLDFPYALTASKSWDLYLSFHLCANVDNWGQGDYTTFDIEFTLHQVNAPVPPIPVAWPLPLPAGAPIPPGPGMTYPEFDGWMLAMDVYLGKWVPFTCDIVEIQQPAEVDPGQLFDVSVDVRNVGSESGSCDLTVLVEDEAGNDLFGTPVMVNTGPLEPGAEPTKIEVLTDVSAPAGLAGQTLTVTATCDEDTMTCEIYVLKPATLVVTGIEQEPTIHVCETLTVAVNVKNVGDVSGEGIAWVVVSDALGKILFGPVPLLTGMVGPGGTVKLPLTIGHVVDSWIGTDYVVAGMVPSEVPQAMCQIVVSEAPPPTLQVSSKWWYDVNYTLGTAAGEPLVAVVGTALVGGPTDLTVKYVNEDGVTKFAAALTIPLDAPLNWSAPIVLAGDDTGARDVITAVDSVAVTAGAVGILGGNTGILAGSLDLTTKPGVYTDGMPLYTVQDTVMTTHLVQLNVNPIPDMVPLCTTVPIPPGPADHAVIDPSMGGLDPPFRPLPGTPYSMATMTIDAFASPTNGTSQYVYLTANLLGIIPMKIELGYHTYVLTGGANIGQPYAAGNSWTYIVEQEAYIAPPSGTGCMSYGLVAYTCSVAASGVSVTVPKGTFTDCFQITTDNPLAPGTKTDYWSPTVMGIVKTVDTETYAPGVETTVLTNFALNW